MAVALRKLVVWGLLAAGLNACSVGNQVPTGLATGQPKAADEPSSEYRKVVRIVDGDTIVIAPNEKIRLIGVDTPETVHPKKAVQCFGKDAKEFTRKAIEGHRVRLVLDQVNFKTKHKDKYGRTLGYVYLDNGQMLNRELIRQGYAHAYTRFPFLYLAQFRDLERQARQTGAGLWSSCPLSRQL